jgi:hypothetical protein
MVDLPVRIGVRAPHEALSDERDVELFHMVHRGAGLWPAMPPFKAALP